MVKNQLKYIKVDQINKHRSRNCGPVEKFALYVKFILEK